MQIIFFSFIFFTMLVALITYFVIKGQNLKSTDGFFLGGRSLTSGVIASSLLLTNLSATHFVGMSSDVYRTNMSTIGWEIPSAVALSIVAIFLLPRYLKVGLTTIPDFLEDRYDKTTKKIVTYLFILGYVLNMLPITLYAGSVTLIQIFDFPKLFGISYQASLIIAVVIITFIGCAYALMGGLKAVATADSVQGVMLLIGGILVPVFGVLAIGKGHFFEGFHTLVTSNPQKFNGIGSSKDLLPFATNFTGLMLVLLYFWGTDQAIIQRALAAKNLKEGQKGVMFAGVLKCLTPLILMVPGLIAFTLYGNTIENPDLVYPTLVNDVLPKPLVGFFVAAMFGAVLSTFNGVLNSTSTLFALNIYKDFRKDLTEQQLIKSGKKFGIIIAMISMVVAPFIMYAPKGLYTHLQTINGFTNVPIFTVIIMGYANKYAPAISAKISLVFFVLTYGILQYGFKNDLHYLHRSAILFIICCTFMYIMGKIKPRKTPFALKPTNVVDVEPWKYRYEFSAVLIWLMTITYIIFSPIGLAREGGMGTDSVMWICIGGVVIAVGMFFIKKAFCKDNVVKSNGQSLSE